MKTIRNIVFDYGGVLIDLDFSLTLNAMERLGVNAFGKEITNVYTCKGVLGLYERGEISTDEFRDYIRSLSTHKGLSNEAIDQAWCALMLDVPTYKQQLLLQLKQKYKIYMLSNTNPLHVDCSLERCFGKDGHTPHDYFDRFFFHTTCICPNRILSSSEVLSQSLALTLRKHSISMTPQPT